MLSWFSNTRDDEPATNSLVTCKNKCVGYEVENNICKGCGVVISELRVSDDVEFDSATNRAKGTRWDHTGNNKSDKDVESSYNRVAVGRAAIRKIASAISCEREDIIAVAQRTYGLALIDTKLMKGTELIERRKFMKRGRPVDHVAAACVYYACRKCSFPILLMDLCQILQINIFKLGRVVKKLCAALYLEIPRLCPLLAPYGKEYVDVSQYIARFVDKLEFPDNDKERVKKLALRVLQKMQNDWIQCGRHPAGLFGASIVIAARVLGYKRTHKEVARQVFIGGVTIGKRVHEFAKSTAEGLTLRDLEDLNFGASANPPAFEEAEKARKEAREKALEEALKKNLKKLKESEAPTGDMKAWLDAGKKETLFSEIEHEDDEPLSDSELDGYILDVAEHKDEIRARENMYSLQYGAWEVEHARKLAEKLRVKQEQEANNKRKRLPKNKRAAKKRRQKRKSAELNKCALNDPETAALLKSLAKKVAVAPAEILADTDTDTDMEEETDTANDTKPTKMDTENTSTATDTTKPTKDDYNDDKMSDVPAYRDDIDYDLPEHIRNRTNFDDDSGGDPFDGELDW